MRLGLIPRPWATLILSRSPRSWHQKFGQATVLKSPTAFSFSYTLSLSPASNKQGWLSPLLEEAELYYYVLAMKFRLTYCTAHSLCVGSVIAIRRIVHLNPVFPPANLMIFLHHYFAVIRKWYFSSPRIFMTTASRWCCINMTCTLFNRLTLTLPSYLFSSSKLLGDAR